jgi:hypothetical protein
MSKKKDNEHFLKYINDDVEPVDNVYDPMKDDEDE